jgi:ABC-type transport system involved in multi-copper enzyme maturation permease subunit
MDELRTTAELEEIERKGGRNAVMAALKSDQYEKSEPLKNIPAFRFQKETITESSQRAWLDISILLILNVLFFMSAYVTFIREDVR